MDIRIIPTLLLADRKFVKTTAFADPQYIGDPINTVRLFNDKEADEMCILDFGATVAGRGPDFDFLGQLASECFMPLSYGGGLRTVEDCARVLAGGFEKVVVNSAAFENPALVPAVAERFGAQSVVVAVDVKDGRAWTRSGGSDTGLGAVEAARHAEALGAGEILLTAIDRDGTRSGYDLDLIAAVSRAVSIPVIASGGASGVDDLVAAVRQGHASAVAAGALFVYYGRRRAVLINPTSRTGFARAWRKADHSGA